MSQSDNFTVSDDLRELESNVHNISYANSEFSWALGDMDIEMADLRNELADTKARLRAAEVENERLKSEIPHAIEENERVEDSDVPNLCDDTPIINLPFLHPGTVISYDLTSKHFSCESPRCKLATTIPMAAMMIHVAESHTRTKMFKCPQKNCYEKFKRTSNITQHLEQYHKMTDKKLRNTLMREERNNNKQYIALKDYLQSLLRPTTKVSKTNAVRHVVTKHPKVNRTDAQYNEWMTNFKNGLEFRNKWNEQEKTVITLDGGKIKVETLTHVTNTLESVVIIPNLAGEFTMLACQRGINVRGQRKSLDTALNDKMRNTLQRCFSNFESQGLGKDVLPQYAVHFILCPRGTILRGNGNDLVPIHNQIKMKGRRFLKEKGEFFALRMFSEAEDVDENETHAAFSDTLKRYKALLKPELEKLGGKLKSDD